MELSTSHLNSSDQVSSVSTTNMVEDLETQEEEILSMDMGHESLHEINEMLAAEEIDHKRHYQDSSLSGHGHKI
ncbi:hypothetical protein GOP47_0010658 [Adiantum capillus-veneris]|uniref:Uncharacterized protein n=1 Tax=Adiantum capillus-veneris TaxID=13818 RepID=A0A9D4UWG1_ADICA|nr:hypothetical protein GOP47_0010658 [Adiantum capillus-veneris]